MSLNRRLPVSAQLADHERRPPLGEDFRCLRDGAELTVAGHEPNLLPSPGVGNCRFCS
jgi:hypothetical protein